MKVIVCSQCGGNNWQEKDGFWICAYCGTIFKPTKEDGLESSTNISIQSDVQRLLQKCKTDPKNAKTYANLILDIDPTNTEALKYL